jgi:hypothetical protein
MSRSLYPRQRFRGRIYQRLLLPLRGRLLARRSLRRRFLGRRFRGRRPHPGAVSRFSLRFGLCLRRFACCPSRNAADDGAPTTAPTGPKTTPARHRRPRPLPYPISTLYRRTSSPPFWSSPFPVPLKMEYAHYSNRQLDSMLYRTVGSKISGVDRRCQNHVLRRRPFSQSRSRHLVIASI